MAFSLKKVFGSLQSKSAPVASVVGIDIGHSTIKVVELEQSQEAPILKTYGEIQVGPYADQPVGASVEMDNDVLAKGIVDVLRESGVTATHGVLSLPLSTGFVTMVTITTRDDEELASRIPVEARKYIPLSLQEITLDWAPIGESQTNDRGESVQDVLLVALQNESILGFKTLLEHVDLPAQPMELGMFSAARAVGAYETTLTAVLDLGASVSKLYVYQGGSVAAIHRFSVGGSQVTEKLAELLSLDFAAAEAYKRDTAANPDQAAEVKKVTAAVLEHSLHEVRRVLQKFETSHGATIDTMYLAGGVSNTNDIERYVADVLQRPVTRAFPFAQVGYPAFMEDVLRSIGPVFVNSLGAALRLLQ